MVDDYPFLISTASPSQAHRKMAFVLVAILCLGLVATIPAAHTPLTGLSGLLPAYAAAALLLEALTAALLLALYSAQLSPAIMVLGSGYLFSALLIIPWALTFPDIFPRLGLDPQLQSAAFVAAFRRLGFPLFVLAYLALRDRPTSRDGSPPAARRMVGAAILIPAALVSLLSWLAIGLHGDLPTFMASPLVATSLWSYIPAAALVLYGVALVWLPLRRRTIIDLWLIVVLFAMMIETVLLGYVSAGVRLSLGWWAGRTYGLAASGIVLIVLFVEQVSLHDRLARSMIAERRARANRLTAMEALSASIAHEINQPLASIVTNADAGLRWLGRGASHADEVQAALQRIVAEGHRAGEVVRSIRSMFSSKTRETVPVAVNDIVAEAARRCSDELRLSRIVMDLDLGSSLPKVPADPVQLQQLVSNLIANAVDAMEDGPADHRILRITTRKIADGSVAVSVADTGCGIEPDLKPDIFKPFVSTKPDGMGMGLMFSRLVVEAHGGRLTMSDNDPRGTIFEFLLPAMAEIGSDRKEAGHDV